MPENNEISIRKVKVSDIKKLKRFFIKGYGKHTIFQNENFLLYYFDSKNENVAPLSANLIGTNSKGDIVSHYGGLFCRIKINGKIISIIWGVNAFTLPQWRGKGVNGKIVNFIRKNNEANAVLGMPFNAPFFYKKLGYTIFNKDTLNRFAFVLDAETFGVIDKMGQNVERAKELLTLQNLRTIVYDSDNIVTLTKNNLTQFVLDLEVDSVASTYRDEDFLRWRLFENPYVDYKVYGYQKNMRIISYIVLREETLSPFDFRVNRIIDLFGKKEGIRHLLTDTIDRSFSSGHIYLDFSMFGNLYEKEIMDLGFNKLQNDDVCLLPQVTSPVEDRPNHEFIVIQSNVHDKLIKRLTKENVYFTRIDGDRDRIAGISRIE